jgi:ankyrin repeat protein
MTGNRENSSPLTAADVLARYNDQSFPDFCDPLIDVNQVGTFGNRPLHMASYHGNLEEIEALVKGGAVVNVVGDMGTTPLHEAASQGHTEAVRFLLAHGADSDVKDEFGKTPLDWADLGGHLDVATVLNQSRRGKG